MVTTDDRQESHPTRPGSSAASWSDYV